MDEVSSKLVEILIIILILLIVLKSITFSYFKSISNLKIENKLTKKFIINLKI